jgi:6-phosphogluconate dehydrogenase
MREASKEYGYDLHFSEIARTWKGGCIIRARLLEPIKQAFAANPGLLNLLVAPGFSAIVNDLQIWLRAAVMEAPKLGVPVLALSASLNYIDAYRRERMPANLLQAQRDYFGAHTYERLDKPAGQKFHTNWQQN